MSVPSRAPAAQEISYAAYIAPALLAVSAMNGAVYDSTWNVFFKMNFAKLYQGMLYTSLGPLDVAMGEIFLALLRGAMYATGFTAVMGVMGLITTPWAILMIPASVLIAFGFASFGMGITSFMKTFQQMDWINFVMLPMFLFSATFYPLSVYPQYIQWLIQAMPLWHGVELLRQISVGVFTPGHRRAHRLLPRHDCPRRAAHHRPPAQAVPQIDVLRKRRTHDRKMAGPRDRLRGPGQARRLLPGAAGHDPGPGGRRLDFDRRRRRPARRSTSSAWTGWSARSGPTPTTRSRCTWTC